MSQPASNATSNTKPMIFIASGEGQIDQRACYCKEDIRKAYIDFVLGGNDEGFHDRELSSFMENFEDGDNWMLDTIYRCEIGETGHIEIIRVDCALSAIPSTPDADAVRFRQLMADPETGRHLLLLLSQGRGDEHSFRKMMDRIAASKEAANAR